MRKGGNPVLKQYQYKVKNEWGEPCKEQVQFKLPASLKKELMQVPNWQEMVRKLIAKELNFKGKSDYNKN